MPSGTDRVASREGQSTQEEAAMAELTAKQREKAAQLGAVLADLRKLSRDLTVLEARVLLAVAAEPGRSMGELAWVPTPSATARSSRLRAVRPTEAARQRQSARWLRRSEGAASGSYAAASASRLRRREGLTLRGSS